MFIKAAIIMGIIVAVLGIGFLIRLLLLAGDSRQHDRFPLGLVGGDLRECPASPNCYRSERPTAMTPEDALAWAQDAVRALGGEVLETQPDYLRAVFTTSIFGYVDDLEVLVQPGSIRVRSASRVGYSDMGVNRKRVEKFLDLLSLSTN